jgi:hypothetical protein
MRMRDVTRLSAAMVVSVCLSGALVLAQGGGAFSAGLTPDQEVPSVSSGASGSIELDIDGEEIRYTLSFSGLSSDVAQAHIHFAQEGVNGGIMLWLCEGTSLSPVDTTPACPQSGTVTGVLTPADVVAIGGNNAGQQIAAGEFEEAVAAIRKGLAYANVHTALSPGGEIRGQLRQGGGHK